MSYTNPLSELADNLKTRLAGLEASIRAEAVTVSFFLEDKDAQGRKKSAFNSLRAVPDVGTMRQVTDTSATSGPWTSEEAQMVMCLLSKQVVIATYRDAVKRGFLAGSTAKEEVHAIVARYDHTIANMLKKGSDDE